MGDLTTELGHLDGRSYPAYKRLRGRTFDLGGAQLTFSHVQGDPFAAPSRLQVDLPPGFLPLAPAAFSQRDARRACADWLHRLAQSALRGVEPERAGSGKSGQLEIAAVGQEVLERTAVDIDGGGSVKLRLTAGLPAAGRRILGRAAVRLLTQRLPHWLDTVRNAVASRGDALLAHVRCTEDQCALRARLDAAGLVAFVADGSRLARRSGADDRPLDGATATCAPEALAVELDTPHAGRLRGLGVPTGVTLIVGGGYHGKSTLLDAIGRSVYDHVPGDGRERCVTTSSAVSIRAEDGRSVRGVDLRPFIRHLPLGRSTQSFSTDDASGSTSQGAAIVEAIELGATALLIDEDTAATNFMIRDARMRRLVPADREPITPYIDRAGLLADTRGISSLLVLGGAGDYLDIANTVIRLDEYTICDATQEAREVAAALPAGDSAPQLTEPWPPFVARRPDLSSLDATRGRRERVRSVKTRAIEFGAEEIDVSLLDQLVDPAQCRAIGDALLRIAHDRGDSRKTIRELVEEIDALIETEGLGAATQSGCGDRSRPRSFEIAAALNRLRSLRLLA